MASSLTKYLPNEHGGWVLLGTGLVVAVAANPGVWQVPAVLGWLGLFFLRVPLTRVLDGQREAIAVRMTIAAFALAALGLGPFLVVQWRVFAWAGVSMIPGLILVALRKRKWLRSIAGELLSMLAIAPLIPSVAIAGGAEVGTKSAVEMALFMMVYLIASVFRVRAISRLGRKAASWGGVLLGGALFPAAVAALWLSSWWSDALALGALPAALIPAALLFRASRKKLSLMSVGLWETAMVLPFALGIVFSFATYL